MKLTAEQREKLRRSIEEWKYMLFKPELQDYVVGDYPTHPSQYIKPNYWWLKDETNKQS